MEIWDPLEIQGSDTTEIVAASRKREIRNILKSYVGFFDPFCELIQNSLDAIDMRQRHLNESGYSKKLWITINLKDNVLSVTDNGIGFKEEHFRMFLSPSISFKNARDTRGNKGVGATYLAYGFNYLQMGTKTPDFSMVAEIQRGREWVDDDEATVARPTVKPTGEMLDPHFTSVDRGSTFALRFTGNVRPRDLSWIGATDASQWKTLLLVKTPLGQVVKRSDSPDATFDLFVINRMGEPSQLLDQQCQYVFPHTVIKACARLADVLNEQQRLLAAGRDSSKLPAKFKGLNAIFDEWSTDSLKGLVLSDDEKAFLETYSVWAYGFFCYSAPKVLDKFSDDIAKLRKGQRVIRGGLQLATNTMPQGELITIPLTSNIGYQNQAHIVVHLSNADPDLGRKGFQPELQRLGERIAVGLVTKLKQWRHLLLTDRGPGGSHSEELALDDWVTSQKEYEQSHPIKLTNEHFFVPVNEISITAQPNSEQDVVALFNQLIAGGVIRGIRMMATSSHQQYDGLFRFHLRPPMSNHFYDEQSNPLGIESTPNPESFVSKPYVLEFKHCFDALISDFENEEKSESSMNLAVVWEMGQRYRERYQAVSLLLPDNRHLRQFHGLTHELHDDNTGEKRMDVIVLSDLISYLNDRGVETLKQNSVYGDTD